MYFLVFIFGLIIGSFINVVIYRVPRGESVSWPPSHCPECGQRLVWWQLVPVISYLFLGGRCYNCKHKIPIRYFLVELFFGCAYLFLFNKSGIGIQFISSAFLFSILFADSVIDLEHRIIPDKLNLVGMMAGFIFTLFGAPGIGESMLGFTVGAGLMLALAHFSKGGMGGGDIKLTAVLGIFLGWQGVLLTIFIASILGSVIGIALNFNKGVKIRKAAIPFGPFLSMGAMVVYLYGSNIIGWYLDTFVR